MIRVSHIKSIIKAWAQSLAKMPFSTRHSFERAALTPGCRLCSSTHWHSAASGQYSRHGINTSESSQGSKVAPFASLFILRTWWSSLSLLGKTVQMTLKGAVVKGGCWGTETTVGIALADQPPLPCRRLALPSQTRSHCRIRLCLSSPGVGVCC